MYIQLYLLHDYYYYWTLRIQTIITLAELILCYHYNSFWGNMRNEKVGWLLYSIISEGFFSRVPLKKKQLYWNVGNILGTIFRTTFIIAFISSHWIQLRLKKQQ